MTGYYCRHCGTVTPGEFSYCPACKRDEQGTRHIAPVVPAKPAPQQILVVQDKQREIDSFPPAAIVPTNLYAMDEFDDVIEFCYIHGARKKHKANDEKFGYEDLGTVPEIFMAMDEIRLEYRKTNQADFYCTLGTWGHSIIQHRYNLDYKAMRGMRTEKFKEGKLSKLVSLYQDGKHLFDKSPNGKKRHRVAFYADVESVLAPITEYSKYFDMSKSDIVQACLCEVILRYKPLHEGNKEFFLDTLEEFDYRVCNVLEKMGAL